jgi:hypothetical protein
LKERLKGKKRRTTSIICKQGPFWGEYCEADIRQVGR